MWKHFLGALSQVDLLKYATHLGNLPSGLLAYGYNILNLQKHNTFTRAELLCPSSHPLHPSSPLSQDGFFSVFGGFSVTPIGLQSCCGQREAPAAPRSTAFSEEKPFVWLPHAELWSRNLASNQREWYCSRVTSLQVKIPQRRARHSGSPRGRITNMESPGKKMAESWKFGSGRLL